GAAFNDCASSSGASSHGNRGWYVVWRKAPDRNRPTRTTCYPTDTRLVCFAQLGRRFDKRVEHRLKVECRTTYDLEYVSSGGLLLQRFAQFVEQPRVLDRYDGLGSEVRHNFNLLFGECTNLLAVDNNSANQLTLFEHGHSEGRSCTT